MRGRARAQHRSKGGSGNEVFPLWGGLVWFGLGGLAGKTDAGGLARGGRGRVCNNRLFPFPSPVNFFLHEV